MSASETKPIRLLLVDDHEMVRVGLRTLLAYRPEVEVVGEAGTAAEALAAAARLRPDVVLMDIRLPDGNGATAARDIRALDDRIRVLCLTSYADDQTLLTAMLAGVQGFVLKQISADELVSTIRQVMAGRTIFDQEITSRVQAYLQGFRSLAEPGKPTSALSPQEQRVVVLVGEGKTNKEIGLALDLSEKTVKNYLANIFDKLNLTRRSQLAVMVAKQGAPPE